MANGEKFSAFKDCGSFDESFRTSLGRNGGDRMWCSLREINT